MQNPKNFTQFFVPTLICIAFLLSWNCQETNSLTSQSTDKTNQENTVNNKTSVNEVKFIPHNSPPPPPAQDVKFIPYDSPPSPLSPIRPKYPQSARKSGIEGLVIIQAFIDEKGFVEKAIVLQGAHNSVLDEAAVDAIKAVHFEPAKQKDKPVGVWISIPVNFKLDDKEK